MPASRCLAGVTRAPGARRTAIPLAAGVLLGVITVLGVVAEVPTEEPPREGVAVVLQDVSGQGANLGHPIDASWRAGLRDAGFRPLEAEAEKRRLTAWFAAALDRLRRRVRNADYTTVEFEIGWDEDLTPSHEKILVCDTTARFDGATRAALAYALELRPIYTRRAPYPASRPGYLSRIAFYDGRRLLDATFPGAIARVEEGAHGGRAWRVLGGGVRKGGLPGTPEADDRFILNLSTGTDCFVASVSDEQESAKFLAAENLATLHPLWYPLERTSEHHPFGWTFWERGPEERDRLEWWESDASYAVTEQFDVEAREHGVSWRTWLACLFRREDGLPLGVFALSGGEGPEGPTAWGSELSVEYAEVQTAEGETLLLPIARRESRRLSGAFVEALREQEPERRVVGKMLERAIHLQFHRLNDAALDNPAAFDFDALAKARRIRLTPFPPEGWSASAVGWRPGAVVYGPQEMSASFFADRDQASLEALDRAGVPIDPAQIQSGAAALAELYRPDPDMWGSVIFEHFEPPLAPAPSPGD